MSLVRPISSRSSIRSQDSRIAATPIVTRSDTSPAHRFRWVGISLLLWLAGCATTPQTLELRRSPPTAIPSALELSAVPFYSQTRYQCGPAALATVMQTAGREVPPEQLIEQVYTPELNGSLQKDILTAASRNGLLAIRLPPRLSVLFAELAAGHPVLVLQNLGFGFYPYWHYAVLVGYDLPQQQVVLRSGRVARLQRGFSVFERTWRRADHWAITVTQPDDLPLMASREAAVEALIRLDRNADADAAYRAYNRASQRWPEDALLWFGLGNAAFRLGRHGEARDAFTRAVKLKPQSAEIWNNLAYAERALGNHAEAVAAIEKALFLRPNAPEVRDSYREITGLSAESRIPH